MNNRLEGNNIASEQAALQLVQQIKFSGKLQGPSTYTEL